jgi:antitoxin component HigA of HigAB toxin-antitoxin module
VVRKRGLPRRQDIDPELRERLAAWTRYLMQLHEIPSLRKMAERMGMAGPTVTNAVNKKAGIGLDYLVALHRTFHVSADVLLDTNPPVIKRAK